MAKKEITDAFRREFEAVIAEAHRISADVGKQVEKLLKVGREQPLKRDEAIALLTTVIEVLKAGEKKRGKASAALDGEVAPLVAKIIACCDRIGSAKSPGGADTQPALKLLDMNGVTAGPLHPIPWFHETRVPMYHGYVPLANLSLWAENDRLNIHLRQFEQEYGRKPDKDELLKIMLSQLGLPGTEEDEFEIEKLANNIAVNGVRKPPVLDTNGVPLDGNRRIAACLFILHSDEYTDVQKKNIENLYVWQLTEFATDDDRRAVVVSLNFEDDCKKEWRAYIKARKVFEDWEAMLIREPRAGTERIREMQIELSKRYALGPDASNIKRYLKMYEMAEEYKNYHIVERKRDEFEAEHRTDRDFEYFDELSKGARAGVAYVLEQDDSLKHLVYDLLYDNKFSSWKVVRDLKYTDDEVKAGLKAAADMPAGTKDEREETQDYIERLLVAARNRSKDNRVGNANIRIGTFVKWLRGVPIGTLQEELEVQTKNRLREALEVAIQVMDYEGEGAE